MAEELLLGGAVKRALVVEQLNQDQWHIVARGLPVPARSLEGCGSGVLSYRCTLKDALERSQLTGLPVLVQPLAREPRGLTREEAKLRDRCIPVKRRLTLDELLGSPVMGSC